MFARFSALYEKLTGSDGMGVDLLYDVGLYCYRGDFNEAKLDNLNATV